MNQPRRAMRRGGATIAVCLLLLAPAGCSEREAPRPDGDDGRGSSAQAAAPPAAAPPQPEPARPRWDMIASGEGSGLYFPAGSDRPTIHLFCPAESGELIVNVPAFTPIGSEERMSLGQGGIVATLVADPAGDPHRGGVTGAGPVPTDLAALLGGAPSVSYGAQVSGPHPAPPADLVRDFVAACAETNGGPAGL